MQYDDPPHPQKRINQFNVCYCLNDGYVDYCCVSIVSLLENNKEKIQIHILTDELTELSKKKLKYITDKYNAQLLIYKVDDSKIEGQNMTWSKYAWYRLQAHELIRHEVKKILYLDVDTIVDGDLSEIFATNLDSRAIGAVPDVRTIFDSSYKRVGYDKSKGYFCSGVMLMNLDYFRQFGISDKVLQFAKDNPERINFPDQDALNYVCQDIKIELPLKYDILLPYFDNKRFMSTYRKEVKESLEDPRIIHYAGCNPWKYESEHHYFEDKFWEYASLLPFKVKKTHVCHGIALMKLRTKRLFGYIGIPAFTKYKKARKPKYKDIIRLLGE